MNTARVRLCLGAVDRAMAAMRDQGAGSAAFASLGSAYAALIEALELEPDKRTRPCPKCSRLGMRDATLCGYCWTRLTPLTVSTSASTGA